MIYFIQAESGPVKIGYAKSSSEARLRAIQTGSHERLEVIGEMEGEVADERELHRKFDHAQLRGEWFKPTIELMVFISRIHDMHYRLTVKDCLERIAATKPETILNAINKGELRAVNIGNGLLRPTWRISEEDFKAWIEKRTSRPMLIKPRRRSMKPAVEYV